MAWNPLGWKAQWLAEIEPFPSAVLAHHYPNTPNLGDMTKFNEWPTDDQHAIDLLCGGTPCQSFSVAGLRKGLDDPRGNLMLTFGAIAAKYRPQWLVWENVPGVLSSNGGADFGAFLGMLGQLGYGFAYRVLDAQYFGVAQRRRRVFVVGCLGDWHSAAAVLFEQHSLQGHPAPRRQAGKGFAAEFTPSLTASGRGVERCGDTRGQDPVIAVAPTMDQRAGRSGANSFATSGGLIPMVAPTLTSGPSSPASHGKKSGTDREVLIPVPHAAISPALKARDHKGVSSDGDGDGAILVPMVSHSLRGREGMPQLEYRQDGTANALLTPNGGRGGIGVGAIAFDTTQITSAANYSNPKEGDPCHPLAAGAHAPAIAVRTANTSANGHGISEELAHTLDQAQGQAVAFSNRGIDSNGATETLRAASHGALPMAAYTTKLHNTTSNNAGKIFEERTVALDANSPPPALLTAMMVRRLTPKECARLQGFPDDYLDITVRGKPAADGPKYKALGNSWAVPNVRWIGQRIDAVAEIINTQKAAA